MTSILNLQTRGTQWAYTITRDGKEIVPLQYGTNNRSETIELAKARFGYLELPGERMDIPTMPDSVLFKLTCSGTALNVIRDAGEQGVNDKHRDIGNWHWRFFHMLRVEIAQQVLKELKDDGLVEDISDRHCIHLTVKGISYVRRCKC